MYGERSGLVLNRERQTRHWGSVLLVWILPMGDECVWYRRGNLRFDDSREYTPSFNLAPES